MRERFRTRAVPRTPRNPGAEVPPRTTARHSVGNRRPSFDVLREQQQSTAAVPLFSGAQRGSHALSEPERGLAGVVQSLCKQGVRGSSPLGSTHFPLSDRVCPMLCGCIFGRTAESTTVQTSCYLLIWGCGRAAAELHYFSNRSAQAEACRASLGLGFAGVGLHEHIADHQLEGWI